MQGYAFSGSALGALRLRNTDASISPAQLRPLGQLAFCPLSGYITGYKEVAVGSTAQARAVKNYRKRLSRRGMARFEVMGLKKDRELVRAVARRLAENTPEADEMRAAMRDKVGPDTRKKGGILAMLRSWPIADLNLTRPYTKGRKIDL
jgi:hypothetical protein